VSQSQPKDISQPEFPGQSQTMFITEGISVAALVTRKGQQMRVTHPRYKSPGEALEWCRAHRAGFVYTPSNPEGN
jgi:hypothetical protein